jgi:hypothetical protein
MWPNKTVQDISIAEENGNIRSLTIEDVQISCYYPQGTFIKEDVTCNTQFMLDTMPTIIGAQIHQ